MDAEKSLNGGAANKADEPIDTMAPRIHLLNVPLDIVKKEDLPVVIGNLLKKDGAKHIVLLSLWDLLRARRNNEYRAYVLSADLVIPISKSLVSGARFLTSKEPSRYLPFDFIIALLSILELREYSLYLMGGSKKVLDTAELNVKHTFPKLDIVGRRAARFKKNVEGAILEAIRKASPALLMVGKGVQGGELWIPRKCGNMGSGIRFWCSDIYWVFANKKGHPSDNAFKYGLEWVNYCVRNPFYLFHIFQYMYYKLLLVVYKLFKKKGKKTSSGKKDKAAKNV